MNRKSLLNAANLHVGGGVQVAVSVLSELLKDGRRRPALDVALSSKVEQGIGGHAELAPLVGTIQSLDLVGFSACERRTKTLFDQYTAVFTVFGPLYRWKPPFRSIVGFAQPWIIYPRNEVYAMLPPLARLKARVKFWLQAQFFKRADVLVVELEHVKDGLVRELGIDPARIHIIRNCVSALYSDPALWEPLAMPTTKGILRLGFLGRNYLHKNTAVFPRIVAALRRFHGIEAKVFVTFTPEEWKACSPEFQAACLNVGPLSVAQCPTFYRGVDAVVFPSLLECFSATPLEAMAMGRPLFASDRPFNRDVCGRHAAYFDPLSPETAAEAIARWIQAPEANRAGQDAARAHALAFASPSDRAEKYLTLLGQGDGSSNKSKRLT